MKMTVKGAHISEKSKSISVQDLEGQQILSSSAGLFLFPPFLAQLDLDPILQSAGLPGSQIIAAQSYLLSFLALKLLGTERYAHVGDQAFDPVLGAFAGLITPSCEPSLGTCSLVPSPVLTTLNWHSISNDARPSPCYIYVTVKTL